MGLALVALVTHVDVAVAAGCQATPRAPCGLVATVFSTSAPPPPDKLSLVELDAPAGEIAIHAGDVVPYVQGDEPIALAVVFETHHLWLGDESWWQSTGDPCTGAYQTLSASLATLATAGPPGSQGVLVAYGDGARTLWQGELSELSGAELGTQESLSAIHDADGTLRWVISTDVAAGVDLAIAALDKLPLARKAILVVGDGNGADKLGSYKRQLKSSGIETYALGSPSCAAIQSNPTGWAAIAGANARWLERHEDLPRGIAGVVDAIADRYYVHFPGADVAQQRAFLWDGKPHELAVRGLDRHDVPIADDVALAPPWQPPWMHRAPANLPIWPFALGAIGLIGVGAIGLRVARRRPAPAAPPVAAPAPLPSPVAAPAPPAAPSHTAIFELDDGWPLVGWLVPLDGPGQYQTFRLRSGLTTIGTGGDAHVVIADSFMSTEHARVQMSPDGFTLLDGGSTNGTVVNGRRVDRHELIDNDTFVLGKTRFRFKSTA